MDLLEVRQFVDRRPFAVSSISSLLARFPLLSNRFKVSLYPFDPD
jgi:hypothetical protein